MKKKESIPRAQRRRVKQRDKNRCVVCWRKYELKVYYFYDGMFENRPFLNEGWEFIDDNIVIHHFWDIDGNQPYVDTKDEELVTLCPNCHGKIHTCDKQSPFYQLVKKYLEQFK